MAPAARSPAVGEGAVRGRARDAAVHARAARRASAAVSSCGDGWALLPSAAGVIDPLLSTGFPLTLLGIGRLVDLLERTWNGPGRDAALDEYAQQTQRELDATERLVGGALRQHERLRPVQAAHASLLCRRQLQRDRAAAGAPRPGAWLPAVRSPDVWSQASRAIAEHRDRAGRPTARARTCSIEIDRTIEPFDIAGLGDDARRDWYPVLADDLIAGRDKLGATRAEIDMLLERCGFATQASRVDCRLQIAECRLKNSADFVRMWRQGCRPANSKRCSDSS